MNVAVVPSFAVPLPNDDPHREKIIPGRLGPGTPQGGRGWAWEGGLKNGGTIIWSRRMGWRSYPHRQGAGGLRARAARPAPLGKRRLRWAPAGSRRPEARSAGSAWLLWSAPRNGLTGGRGRPRARRQPCLAIEWADVRGRRRPHGSEAVAAGGGENDASSLVAGRSRWARWAPPVIDAPS